LLVSCVVLSFGKKGKEIEGKREKGRKKREEFLSLNHLRSSFGGFIGWKGKKGERRKKKRGEHNEAR